MAGAPEELDLLVIGGGPAGIVGAASAAVLGKTAAIIDAQPELGGAGVNTGTVPSKTLRETALALSGLKTRRLYGVDLSLRREATVADFLGHQRNVRAAMNAMLRQRLDAARAVTYVGLGSFVDPHTVRVRPPRQGHFREGAQEIGGEAQLGAKAILIATGSSPLRPPLFPWGSPGIYDSDTILELQRVPKTMGIVGAGVIGSEYACTFAALGAEVHLIDGRSVLLPFLDGEISRILSGAMARNGVSFHWNQQVERCEIAGGDKVSLTLRSGEVLSVDALLVAAGRKSNTQDLNLAAAGVDVGERGLVRVDENYQTNVPHIYAAGDVIGFPALASTSIAQGRYAARHAVGMPILAQYPQLLPAGTYTIPEASMVGPTEEALREKGVQYVAGRAAYCDCARGRIVGDTDGLLKLLLRRSDMKLLAVHVIGEQATELVHIGLMAMLADATLDIFEAACFNVPTLGELYKLAMYDAMRQMR